MNLARLDDFVPSGEMPAWIGWGAVVTGVLIVVVSALGGDPTGIPQGFIGLVFWALPGIVIGGLVGALARRISNEVPVGLGFGGLTFVIYALLRLLITL